MYNLNLTKNFNVYRCPRFTCCPTEQKYGRYQELITLHAVNVVEVALGCFAQVTFRNQNTNDTK